MSKMPYKKLCIIIGVGINNKTDTHTKPTTELIVQIHTQLTNKARKTYAKGILFSIFLP